MIGNIVEMANGGKNANEIAAQVHLSASHVRRIARKHGLKLVRPSYKNNLRHGHCPYRERPSPEWRSWTSMKSRCLNPKSTAYHRYGGRGITIAPEWLRFDAFLADMGEKPSPAHSIERRDGDKGYSKDNCVWATQTEQSRNRRYAKMTLGTAQLMRRMYASGLFTQKELGIEFDVSEGHVPSILNQTYWKD